MRPDVGDILGQIQRGLMEEVMPEITNPHVMERVAYMLMLLDHCMKRWDRAYPFMREDQKDLRATLMKIAAERGPAGVGSEREAEAALGEIERLAAEDPPAETLASSVAIREWNEQRRDALSRLLRAITAGDLRKREPLRRIRAHAGAYLRRQIARDREWVRDAGEIVW